MSDLLLSCCVIYAATDDITTNIRSKLDVLSVLLRIILQYITLNVFFDKQRFKFSYEKLYYNADRVIGNLNKFFSFPV